MFTSFLFIGITFYVVAYTILPLLKAIHCYVNLPDIEAGIQLRDKGTSRFKVIKIQKVVTFFKTTNLLLLGGVLIEFIILFYKLFIPGTFLLQWRHR